MNDKPQVHTESYDRDQTYNYRDGHYKATDKAELKVDNHTVFKKDLVDEDGKVTGYENKQAIDRKLKNQAIHDRQ